MADFSKECGMGFSDFSIKEKFDELEEGYYISIICEGFGFMGILKEDNVCYVAMPINNDLECEWKRFDFKTNTICEAIKRDEN